MDLTYAFFGEGIFVAAVILGVYQIYVRKCQQRQDHESELVGEGVIKKVDHRRDTSRGLLGSQTDSGITHTLIHCENGRNIVLVGKVRVPHKPKTHIRVYRRKRDASYIFRKVQEDDD